MAVSGGGGGGGGAVSLNVCTCICSVYCFVIGATNNAFFIDFMVLAS